MPVTPHIAQYRGTTGGKKGGGENVNRRRSIEHSGWKTTGSLREFNRGSEIRRVEFGSKLRGKRKRVGNKEYARS